MTFMLIAILVTCVINTVLTITIIGGLLRLEKEVMLLKSQLKAHSKNQFVRIGKN